MSHVHVRRVPRALRPAVLAALLAACGDSSPTEQPPPSPPPTPVDVGITGVTNPNAIVCARNAAGTAWCSQADGAGIFRIVNGSVAPGTGTGALPVGGVLALFTVDCRNRETPVDRDGAQRNGGAWLDVSCMPQGCVAPPSGLRAWYTFDEAGGDSAMDLAHPGSADVARLSEAGHVSGRVLGGLALVSSAGHARAPASRNLGTDDFTIAMWVRLDPAAASWSTLLDKRDVSPIRGYHIALSGGEPLIQLADASPLDGGYYNYHSGIFDGLADGTWHHLAVTVRRSAVEGVRWYLDGRAAGVVHNPRDRQGSLDSSAPLFIGRHSYSEGTGPGGAVDELMIVGRVLTPEEIATVHARSLCR